ncbi:hypothetical protein MMC08_005081 [Hypocenomyce scalaris]|nr:hypothetical protein [Hypocenomyce scalaris]
MLDFFHSQGGNFIDTANEYQDEQTETWLGDWMASRPGMRDQMVIATKYSLGFTQYKGHGEIIHSNNWGNSAKSLRLSLNASLHKLQTDYVDILYVHFWDWTASIQEVMHSLNTMVEQGKVLYLGISDTPAWVVTKANEYARHHGLSQFVVYQGRWSASVRDFERDIIPMCRAEGMALAPWGALGAGNFKSDEDREKQGGRVLFHATKDEINVSRVMDKIAKKKNTRITSVALAYVMHKTTHVFPVCGGRNIDHLKSNIEALGLELSEEEMKEIDKATDFDIGFPQSFVGGVRPQDCWLGMLNGTFDFVDYPKPIPPHKK